MVEVNPFTETITVIDWGRFNYEKIKSYGLWVCTT
jgi:hypothetical protein